MNIQVGDHPEAGRGDGKKQYTFFLHIGDECRQVEIRHVFCDYNIGFHRNNFFHKGFLLEYCLDSLGMCVIRTQSVYIVLQCMQSCCRQTASLPHPASKYFSDAPGFFDKGIISQQKTAFTDEDLARLLHAVGFEGKALKTAWAVVKKESNGRPLAFNGNTRTGDSSYGIFQINMIGGLGVTRRDKFDLDSNKDLFDPVVNAQIAYHMSRGGEDFTAWKISAPYTNRDEIRYKEWYAKFPEGVVNE